MITPSSAFTTANAKLVKQPAFLIEIEGYSRAFGMKTAGGTFPGLSSSAVVQKGQEIWDVGGLELFSTQVVLAGPVSAGNILFYFMYYSPFETVSAGSISDTGGNTWTQIYNDGLLYCWSAVASADMPDGVTIEVSSSHVGALGGGNMECYAVEIDSAFSGFAASGATGTTTVNVTAGATTVNFGVGSGNTWHAVLVELAPASGPQLALTLFFLHLGGWGGVTVPSTLIQGAAASAVYSTGGLATINNWLASVDDQKLTVSDLDGGANLADLTFTVQDNGQQITADLANFVFEGKQCVLLAGFVGMAISDYLPMFSGQINTVDSANGNNDYLFTVTDENIQKLSQKIYTLGDDGFATSSSHPKTLLDHPLNILVDALQQAGIPSAKIDLAKIQYYRDGIFSGYMFEFSLSSAPTGKDFIENQIMKPLGMYYWKNNQGVISINSFYPAVSGNGTYTPPTPPVMTAVVSTNPPDVNQLDVPLAQEAPLVNQVVFDFEDDGSGSKFLAEQVVDLDASIAKYGLVGGQTIQSQGMRSGFQGYFQAAFVGKLISLRYGFKTLIFDPLPLTWNACVLEPGDIIAVTNPFVPDRIAGVLGINDMFFEVLDRNWRFMDGVIEVKLLAIDYSLFKQYKITSNGEADYASASTADKAALMFQCNADGKYSTGALANTLG